MFCATRYIVYHQEILEYCLYYVCMVGGKFLEAYELSQQLGRTQSFAQVRLGRPLSSNRPTERYAFSSIYPRKRFLLKNLYQNYFHVSHAN